MHFHLFCALGECISILPSERSPVSGFVPIRLSSTFSTLLLSVLISPPSRVFPVIVHFGFFFFFFKLNRCFLGPFLVKARPRESLSFSSA